MRRKIPYDILVRHEGETCPQLPELPGKDLKYYPKEEGMPQCPSHLVFSRACDISVARDRIERLKAVKGLLWIRLYLGREAKEQDRWKYNTASLRWERE